MRSKESAVDYRFLPEPDLPLIRLDRTDVEKIRATLPELPRARAMRLQNECGVTEYDAEILVSDPALADYYETAVRQTAYPKTLVNLLLSELLRHCTADPFTAPVSECRLSALAELSGSGKINSAIAKKLLARLLISDFDPCRVVDEEDLGQIRDEKRLRVLVDEVIAANPRAVSDYKNGKTAAMRALQGQAMARTAGRADPVMLERFLLDALTSL